MEIGLIMLHQSFTRAPLRIGNKRPFCETARLISSGQSTR